MYFKKNKYFIIAFVLMLLIIFVAFKNFHQEYFGYVRTYNLIKENCYEGKDLDYFLCERYDTPEKLEEYLTTNDPTEIYESFDVRYVVSLLRFEFLFSLPLLFPLLIAILVIVTIHKEYSSGMFKNMLMRMNYKKYVRRYQTIAFKAALIPFISWIIIFLIALIYTDFNFGMQFHKFFSETYYNFLYNHTLLYAVGFLFVIFCVNYFYANIALFFVRRNKNMFVAIIQTFITAILFALVMYLLFAFGLSIPFGLTELVPYFNFISYCDGYYETLPILIGVMIISFIISLISTLIIKKVYSKKEKLILDYETKVEK